MKSGYQTNVKNVAEIVPIATKSTQINVKKLKVYLHNETKTRQNTK